MILESGGESVSVIKGEMEHNTGNADWSRLRQGSERVPTKSTFCLGKLSKFVSSAATFGPSLICSRIPGLSPEQIRICEEQPTLINCIRQGYKEAAKECKNQFRNNIWNCTVLGQSSDFDDLAIPGTKEAAFAQSMVSAGVVYTITRACSMGNLSECNCDREKWGQNSRKGWMWGGCSVDTGYGMNLSRRFVNGRHNTHDAIYLMNKHNNKAGRQVLKEKLVLECKCHGLSGSCTTRTCWKALPSIRVIGERLKEYYYNAVRVSVITVDSNRGPKPEYLVLKSEKSRKPDSRSLVYANDSHTYCVRDIRLGIPGTRDRVCNVTSTSDDSCDSLCCERGHDTHNFTEVTQCRCKFHWCCQVRCKECVQNVVKHTCKLQNVSKIDNPLL